MLMASIAERQPADQVYRLQKLGRWSCEAMIMTLRVRRNQQGDVDDLERFWERTFCLHRQIKDHSRAACR
jgi:hypothetical protein